MACTCAPCNEHGGAGVRCCHESNSTWHKVVRTAGCTPDLMQHTDAHREEDRTCSWDRTLHEHDAHLSPRKLRLHKSKSGIPAAIQPLSVASLQKHVVQCNAEHCRAAFSFLAELAEKRSACRGNRLPLLFFSCLPRVTHKLWQRPESPQVAQATRLTSATDRPPDS